MRKFLKWIGISLATVAGALVVLVAVLVFLGGRKLSATRTVAVETVAVPSDPAAIERGAHLARTRCVFCHGDDLGGKKFIDDASFMVVNGPNLTRGRGGLGSSYADDATWVRAIRHGVNAQGRALIVMPSEVFYFLSDNDTGDLVAYLKSLPPVDRDWPAPRPSVLAKALLGAGKLDSMVPFLYMDHQAARPAQPPPGATAENGEYIARTFGCRNCHGADLSGQLTPGPKKYLAGNLTPGGPLKEWDEEIFLQMVDGREHEEMPWGMLRSMHEDEQRALWRFLAAQPARASTVAAGSS
ncbi:MAG: cytochrome c [Thermoanaerobaculia bacterium]|jgi:mono/diheme cytochrome c family protein|nr:cytochrome c [Thermoanaerobaculia bacterium]MBP9823977.1 cytochrome c [Thermoanaerobaculia bacterium]